jgi:pilus assembly protein CpaD
MKRRFTAIALPLLLAVVACRPGVSEYSGAETPKAVTIDRAESQVPVGFAPGSARLLPRDAARLRQLALAGQIRPTDLVTVSVGGESLLARARSTAVARELLSYGIVATARPLASVPPNRAVVAVGRYMVTLPPCPNWSAPPAADFTNQLSSNFGCATGTNLALMAANPADLVAGRPLGPAIGVPGEGAVQRYLTGTENIPKQFDGAGATPGAAAGTGLAAGSGGGH